MRRLPLLSLALLLGAAACRPNVSPDAVSDAASVSSVSSGNGRAQTHADVAPRPVRLPTVSGSDAELEAVERGDRAFAARLFARLPGGANLFFSPASVRLALSMARTGARGETAQQMTTTLALGPDAEADAHGYASAVRAWCKPEDPPPANAEAWQKQRAAERAQTLRVTDTLWGQAGRAFQPAFLATLKDSYAAPLVPLDFARDPDASRLTINRTIADETEGKIVDLLPEHSVTRDTRLVLTDAVYFKAKWEYELTAMSPQRGDFAVAPGKTVQVDRMEATESFAYAKVNGASVLSLPYAADRMSMVLVVPDAADGLAAVERGITDTTLASWASGLSVQRVHVVMPRWKTTSAFSLVGVLAAMGLPRAFDAASADFSGIDGTHQLYIGDVRHQAFITVDEHGTEAAAATAVLDAVGAAPDISKPVEVHADHPFLYFIEDTQTHMVLFMGRLHDPST